MRIARCLHSTKRSLEEGRYASATVDTAFKQLLSPSLDGNKSIIKSFLQTFIPAFENDSIEDVEEAPIAVPALRDEKEKHTFMDLHVKSSKGTRYIVEMQAERHDMFDERAMYYACYTFSHQLSEKVLGQDLWYLNLKPVIALQILDYDTNKIHDPAKRAKKGGKDATTEKMLAFDRVKSHKLLHHQYVKHYMLTDIVSKQTIQHLQLIQVELPRAEK